MASWPSLPVAHAFPLSLVPLCSLLLPPLSLCSPAPALSQAVHDTVNCEGQETGGGSTGRLMPSYSLHPFLGRWHWTTHSDGVNTTQGSSSWTEIAGTLAVVTSLRKERWCGTGFFIFSMTGNISTPVISTNIVYTYHALRLAILHVGVTWIKNARVLLFPSTEQAQNVTKLNPLLFFAGPKAFSCSVYYVTAHGYISLLSKGRWSPRASCCKDHRTSSPSRLPAVSQPASARQKSSIFHPNTSTTE